MFPFFENGPFMRFWPASVPVFFYIYPCMKKFIAPIVLFVLAAGLGAYLLLDFSAAGSFDADAYLEAGMNYFDRDHALDCLRCICRHTLHYPACIPRAQEEGPDHEDGGHQGGGTAVQGTQGRA